jgi:hypothetical protein
VDYHSNDAKKSILYRIKNMWVYSILFPRMKFSYPKILKSLGVPEIVVIVIFILYLVFPIQTPNVLNPYIESPIGLVVIILAIVALFIYTNPILAVLSIFVGYMLLRRSAVVHGQTAYVQYTPSQSERVQEIQAEVAQNMNLPAQSPNTLEEEVIAQMAPIGKNELSAIIPSTYKPVLANARGATGV